MINITSLQHPTVKKNIRQALWLCKLEAHKTKQRATGYVQNRKGNNFIRINLHPSGEMVCYLGGRGMRNYAKEVIKALEA